MPKICDNKSVGVIIRKGDAFAIITRKNYPVAYAPVAGHVDGDTFKDAAIKEAGEEVGICVEMLEKKLQETFPNPCKRECGSWHEWQVFEATKWSGELHASSDAKDARWVSRAELLALVDRTLYFEKKLGIPVSDLAKSTPSFVEDSLWQENPGLEPVWVVIFEKMKIFNR